MRNNFTKVVIVFILMTPIHAAPAMLGSICQIKGVIKKVSKRENSRKTFGTKESRSYIDWELDLKSVTFIKESDNKLCTQDFFKNKIFQLRFDEHKNNYLASECIEALTQYSGDEYSHGQWVWNIKKCN